MRLQFVWQLFSCLPRRFQCRLGLRSGLQSRRTLVQTDRNLRFRRRYRKWSEYFCAVPNTANSGILDKILELKRAVWAWLSKSFQFPLIGAQLEEFYHKIPRQLFEECRIHPEDESKRIAKT